MTSGARHEETRRSSMFFVSDVESSAQTCAFSLEGYGLAYEEVDALSIEIREAIERFFERREDGGS